MHCSPNAAIRSRGCSCHPGCRSGRPRANCRRRRSGLQPRRKHATVDHQKQLTPKVEIRVGEALHEKVPQQSFHVVCLFVFSVFISFSLCFFACLSSFTDWCTAHKQQFREQKRAMAAKNGQVDHWRSKCLCVHTSVQTSEQRRNAVSASRDIRIADSSTFGFFKFWLIRLHPKSRSVVLNSFLCNRFGTTISHLPKESGRTCHSKR